MPVWGWVLVALAAAGVVGFVVWRALADRRTRHLREQFGPEYDRLARTHGDRRQAEGELVAREKRREQLDIRPLSPSAQREYAQRWQIVQTEFVDSPPDAIDAADGLVTSVMTDRGYPMDDFEQRAADVSVDHADVVENYRRARAISQQSRRGTATTEDLRQAMQHYRALFDELLGGGESDQALADEQDATQREVTTSERTVR